ncbi:MAG: hypothetical protein KGI37_04865 [Alphaproteobacteria bacterium]|nr:hypothetical protein [Alphaproteobacteria bacterium]
MATVKPMTSKKQADFLVVDLQNSDMKFSMAGQMAKVIVEVRQKNGGCMPQDLNAVGFTPQEVVDHWDAAHFLIAINNLSTWRNENDEK